MPLDAMYFRMVQGGLYSNYDSQYKATQANDNLLQQFRTSINRVDEAKRNGITQPMIITSTEVKYKYNITVMPWDELYPGDMIEALGEHMIVVNTRYITPTHKVGIAWLCNVKFRFQNFTSDIIERYAVLDSGVYSTTVGTDGTITYMKRQFKIYISSDDETDKICIDKRLATGTMYDQFGNEILEAYCITGRTKHAKGNYGSGAHLLELSAKSSEAVGTKDNIELIICDYIAPGETVAPDETLLNCEIKGRTNVAIGGSRTYTAVFYDQAGKATDISDIVWDVDLPNGITKIVDGTTCTVVVNDDDSLSGTTLTLTVVDKHGKYNKAQFEVGVF